MSTAPHPTPAPHGLAFPILNGPLHKRASQLFLAIVIAHWAEHIAQAIQTWALGWPRPAAQGILGTRFPWLAQTETLHYAYAIVMLLGLIVLRPAFKGRSRTWWSWALGIQVWHHFEHLLLLAQVATGLHLLGRPVQTSVLQLFLPRVELHLFYNAAVFVPMIVAALLHPPQPCRAQAHALCLRGRRQGRPCLSRSGGVRRPIVRTLRHPDPLATVVDGRRFRAVLGRFPTGVVAVTGMSEGEPVGMTIGTFMSLSVDPPLVSFAVDHRSRSWPRIRRSGSFCVNVFSELQEDLCRVFATSGAERFRGVCWVPSRLGCPIIESILAWIDCELYSIHRTGDHDLVMGLVRDLDVREAGVGPLLFVQRRFGGFRPTRPDPAPRTASS